MPISLEEYVEAMHKMNVPGEVVWLIEYLFTEVLENPNNQVVTGDVELLLGRKPIDFADYAERTAKTGIWQQKVAL